MSGYLATRDGSEADYDAIQLAVMETDRGRWFLSEYARRNRHADTEVLLASLVRIERSITIQREPAEIDRFRVDVLEMARAIARTRAEIAAIKPPEGDGRLVEASGELDSIVSATESATSEILAAAESVQEVAWTLREANADPQACDLLDQHSVAIYTACSFQDLTAQRTRKVIEILDFLERRVNAMADIWQFANQDRDKEAVIDPNAGLPVDPAMSQADVDFVLVEDEPKMVDFEIQMDGAGVDQLALAATSAVTDLELQPADPLMDASQPLPPPPVEAAAWQLSAVQASAAPTSAFDIDTEAFLQRDEPEAVEFDITDVSPSRDLVLPEPAASVHADTTGEIDDILFSKPDPTPAPVLADGRPGLQLVPPASVSGDGAAERRDGVTAAQAASALDILKNMSVEERTRLFS